jgi:AcrR family transcriptional regulator
VTRLSFREKVLRAREDAIVASVNRLLATKGFDLMTVDEVAADVGIAKASLYKHFASKEALAAAAMVRVLDIALQRTAELQADASLDAFDKLKAITRWALQTQLAGEMPSLPAQNSSLRNALMTDRGYVDRLIEFSDRLGEWISAAQAGGRLSRALPPEVVLYTLFARACDPVPGVLRAGGSYEDEQLIEWVLATCFDGLASRA